MLRRDVNYNVFIIIPQSKPEFLQKFYDFLFADSLFTSGYSPKVVDNSQEPFDHPVTVISFPNAPKVVSEAAFNYIITY